MSRFASRLALVSALALVLGVACGDDDNAADREPAITTLDRTILLQPDGSFLYGPGEDYVVRTELVAAHSGREETRESLAVFHHLSDFALVDEESPLRSEWLESCPQPVTNNAFRPQESLSLHAAAALINRANEVDRSPVTGEPVDLAIHTGNEADNAQINEQRWFMDLLDGRPIMPDTGGIGYEGVQEEPVSPAYPSLLEDAQAPFVSEGIDYPWYATVGNRDILAQGNFPPTDTANALATGDEKLLKVGPDAMVQVCAEPSELLTPGLSELVFSDPETVVETVQPDDGRRLAGRSEWVREHFSTSDVPGPPGHGFSEANRTDGSAYFTLDMDRVSFVVLDTVNEGGFSTGSIGQAQFKWLEDALVRRSSSYFTENGRRVTTGNEDRLIVIVSHHTPAAMNNPFPGSDPDELRFRGPQLEELLHRFPNVVLHLAGHALENRITARPDPEERTRAYWEVTTASPGVWPMQGRLMEIVDNGDGTISIFSTVYDSAAPIKPGEAKDPTPEDGVNELLLAAVARQVAVTDPQLDLDAIGLAASDRNAELLIAAPF